MTIKLKMIPQPQNFGKKDESGIRRVVEAYFKYLPQYDIDLVDVNAKRYDLKAVHAGMTDKDCDIAHLHGIYFTADYPATEWEFKANANIVNALHHAKQVTVPSRWVTETFQRDMRFTPHVVPHGIEWQEWQHSEKSEGYVLWNKNRNFDVCSPDSMGQLAMSFPQVPFLSTFMPKRGVNNITELGIIPHKEMKELVQKAGVYLSTTKETFGLGVLEAMASGVPVLGWRFGGNVDLVQHGINGYLAKPGNMEDLKEGLIYCLRHRKTLGDNGREMAKVWTWEAACEKLVEVYRLAMRDRRPTVSIIIPVYNKTKEQVQRAIDSCLGQTIKPLRIIVVNDGSQDTDLVESAVYSYSKKKVTLLNQNNQGVANARNNGIALTNSKYICCLDADDWLEPLFLERCVNALEDNSSLGIAYTSIQWHDKGKTGVSEWPGDWDFDKQVKYRGRQNQVPTCCVFKREMWERLGGYRQRYAPDGAGAEDAEFWTRAGAYGYKAEKVTAEPLFNYSFGGQVGSNPDYREVDWLAWHPWAQDKDHPLASYAKPKNNLLSHPVRQYDEPVVSVIVPVGPGHEDEVINALDSLEAQTFRKWEAIVVWDNAEKEFTSLEQAYPYVRNVGTVWDRQGAGVARNIGAEIARGHFLLFLDADDILLPTCLERMLEEYSLHQSAIYSDHYGTAIVSPELAQQTKDEGRLEYYNEKTGLMMMRRKAFDYNCKRAQGQPTHVNNVYIWNNITTLIPKSWHFEIGGFDEQMETWEDWDYWLRMAKAGKCFTRIPEYLMTYRYYTGERRNKAAADTLEGRQLANNMLEYIKKKEIEIMPGCSGCGGKKSSPPPVPQRNVAAMSASGEEFVRAEYVGGKGNRHVLGAFVFDKPIPGRAMKRRNNGYVMNYGYFAAGKIVDAVHVEDVRLMVHKWRELPKVVLPEEIIEPPSIPEPLVPPEPLGFDLQTIPGVTADIAKQMKELGLTTKEAIDNVGGKYLKDNIVGVAEHRARQIMKSVRDSGEGLDTTS